jgi:hypothetical protein
MYVALRAPGIWYGQELIDTAGLVFEPQRVASLATRIDNENTLAARARLEPIFGWGGWGRSRIYDSAGNDISITDSQWIITFGINGGLGLAAFVITGLLPAVLLRRKVPPWLWMHPGYVSGLVFALLVGLWMIDNTVNAMFNPVYLLMSGGLAGLNRLVILPQALHPRPRHEEDPLPAPLTPSRPATVRARRKAEGAP